MGFLSVALAPLPTSHPPPSSLAFSWTRDWFACEVLVLGSFAQPTMGSISRITKNSVGWSYRTKCYSLLRGSGAICLESFTTRWLANTASDVDQAAAERGVM